MKKLLPVIVCGLFNAVDAQPNLARPSEYSYANPAGGREGHRFTDKTVNEARLYNFYTRQADFYMDDKNPVPEVLPAYPGLDAGVYGHWGKHEQGRYVDNRWNDMKQFDFMGQLMGVAPDTISLILDPKKQVSAAFSAKASLSFYKFWEGGFAEYDGFRWGTSRGVKPKGKILFDFNRDYVVRSYFSDGHDIESSGWNVDRKDRKYLGMYDTDQGVVFSYEIEGKKVLDHLTVDDRGVFVRYLEFPQGMENKTLSILTADGETKKLSDGSLTGKTQHGRWTAKLSGGKADLVVKQKRLLLQINEVPKGGQIVLKFSAKHHFEKKGLAKHKVAKLKLSQMTKDFKTRWNQKYETAMTLSKNDSRAYVVDDVGLPYKNPSKSLFFLTDIKFDAEGVAYISTLQGEIYKVVGLGDKSGKVTWQKIATGLNQPFGLILGDDGIYVLEREQLSHLKDLNGDGEIDFYGCFSNQIKGLTGSHTHTFGLARDKDGAFHFVARHNSYKIDTDGNISEELVRGLRNCMGFGQMTDGTILLGPQEGDHTPTSTIIEVKKGDNYGIGNDEPLSIPLAYVPRGIDNSTGGFLGVDSDRWGPVGENGLVGICYGYGSWYSILFDQNAEETGRRQVAVVPMPGDFESGVVRGAVNPKDGQVYLVGLDGWGDYAVTDGCLHRLRYTGKPMYQPTGYEVFDNGIRVDFGIPLDAETVKNPKHFFAHMWDYNNSAQYGSPEFSLRKPKSLGHDPLKVVSAHVVNDGKSLFVEIPELQPAMQMHLRMHLKTAEGKAFKTNLFSTIVELGEYFSFKGAQPRVADKPRTFVLRTDRGKKKTELVTQSGQPDAHAKKIKITTIKGLKYDVTSFKVKAGENVALVLHNDDEMPHNLVICKPGTKKAVGEAAFKMLSDPEAGEKHYIPDDQSDVVAYTYVISAKATHTTYFEAPKEKGTYPFICTFPGHWQVMQGEMIVE